MDTQAAAAKFVEADPILGGIIVILLGVIGILWKLNQSLHADRVKDLREVLQTMANFNTASAAIAQGLETQNRAVSELSKAVELMQQQIESSTDAVIYRLDGRSNTRRGSGS